MSVQDSMTVAVPMCMKAEWSTQWPSAQYFRSVIQPDYRTDMRR